MCRGWRQQLPYKLLFYNWSGRVPSLFRRESVDVPGPPCRKGGGVKLVGGGRWTQDLWCVGAVQLQSHTILSFYLFSSSEMYILN